MVNYLKRAAPRSQQADSAVAERVRAMLDDIERNRDQAVRRYARELDRWENPEFRVSADEIDAARNAVSATFKDDFAYCKAQITEFARRQRESMTEFETEAKNKAVGLWSCDNGPGTKRWGRNGAGVPCETPRYKPTGPVAK